MQRVIADINGRYEIKELPDADTAIWPGVKWGRFEEALTPAFWVTQAWMSAPRSDAEFQLGKSLVDETVFCLLGGYGAPAEIGLAASRRVCDYLAQMRKVTAPKEQFEELLMEPLEVDGRLVRYRFARQRARYLEGALEGLSALREALLDDVELRDQLSALPGIGPKTASWIVRNRRGSDRVAILDVHIVRACSVMGVFPAGADPARHYVKLERLFLDFCKATEARASALDAAMWGTMRRLRGSLIQQIVDSRDPSVRASPKEQMGKQLCLDLAVTGMIDDQLVTIQ